MSWNLTDHLQLQLIERKIEIGQVRDRAGFRDS